MADKRRKFYRYALIQDGVVVAAVESTDKAQAIRDIEHYATQYGQDGPVTIVRGKR